MASNRDLRIGGRYLHPEEGEIEIIGGCYLDPVYGRVSNFWDWVNVRTGKHGHGYGGPWPQTIKPTIYDYVDCLVSLHHNAGKPQQDAYTVALGQLLALKLIDEPTWKAALDAR